MSRRSTLAFGWALALAAIVLFSLLGRWQLSRMHEKQAMLDQVAAVLAEREVAPLALAQDPQRRLDYDWSGGRGRFAPGPALLLDNQQRGGRSGVLAYRVFLPQDAPPLLVELGWLPMPADRTPPAVASPDGEFEIQGLLAPPPSHGLVDASQLQQASPEAWLAIGLDVAVLRERLGQPALAPRVLKLDPQSPLGHARDLDILPNTLPPEKHLGYAVQWFGLALAVLATALILTFRRRRA